MEITRLKYIDFLQLPEEKRIELHELFNVAEHYGGIDCYQWEWEVLKDTQTKVLQGITYLEMLETVKLVSNVTENTDYHIIFTLYNEIADQIKEITENEMVALSHSPTPKEIVASESVGGFERFGYLPSTLELAKMFNCTFEQVKKIKYIDCFVAMAYAKTQADFNKLIYTTND
jgi:hypothetical protein